ncbi:MAG: paraquat-inducible protein A [Pseudomonadota bacterium]
MEVFGKTQRIVSARSVGLVACQRCTKASPIGTSICPRCSHRLQTRDPLSLQRVWAFWIMGIICYIPANIFPMLRTKTLFQEEDSTIIGGALDLAQAGDLVVAGIILFASVVIPIGKFWAIAFLALGLKRPQHSGSRLRMITYEIVEYIGRWSMIDIFVVAILSSLVQLQTLASITPGTASLFFALSVIFTMLSAQAFDPRLIWDADEEARKHSRA